MKGGHDLGGKKGFGPISPEPESTEPCFHADWERAVFALTLASGMLGKWNLDESRHARERQEPADYLRHSYYENWLVGIENLLVEKHLISPQELKSGAADRILEKEASLRIPTALDAKKILSSGGPTLLSSESIPQFQVGDRVRVNVSHDLRHTRMPGYAMNAIGTIACHHGCHIYPDDNAVGTRTGEHLYSVFFAADVLWEGAQGNTEENSEVAIDLWQPYLARVTQAGHE